MPRYYLDTNMCIYAWQRRDARVLARMRSVDQDSLVVPALVAAELVSGVMRSTHVERNRVTLKRTLALYQVESWGSEAIWLYGQHAARLRQAGTPIGAFDLLIGCQVLADPEGVLVTHNVREFQRIDGLRVEDWAVA